MVVYRVGEHEPSLTEVDLQPREYEREITLIHETQVQF